MFTFSLQLPYLCLKITNKIITNVCVCVCVVLSENEKSYLNANFIDNYRCCHCVGITLLIDSADRAISSWRP